jgi:D-alanyl-D-alanine carboxypeptidase
VKNYLPIPLSLFIVFFPVLGSTRNPRQPNVKAFYTTDSPLPEKIENPSPLSLSAEGVFVMDLHSGVVLYNKNPHKKLKPASLTKIMTSLVALDYFKEDSIVKVVNGQRSLGNTIDLIKGDQLLASDLLYGLLVSSGNDAAITFAENYPGLQRLCPK